MKTAGPALVVILLFVQVAFAQPAVWPNAENLKAQATRQADLTFPTKVSELGFFSGLDNGFFKPEGPGRFPAVVLLHSCGGINQDLRYWAKEALKAGYAVLIPDSMRGAQDNCSPPLKVWPGRRAKDALDAAAHLAKLPFIDAARIYALGFSQGGKIALVAAGAQASAALVCADAPRFAAVAVLYPACGSPLAPPRTPIRGEYLQRDTERRLLLLMAEGDNEVYVPFCLDMLPKLKESGTPAEWHVYPGSVTHCWDCSSLNNFSKTDFKGDRIVYRYDREVTEDSRKRVFEFFARQPPVIR